MFTVKTLIRAAALIRFQSSLGGSNSSAAIKWGRLLFQLLRLKTTRIHEIGQFWGLFNAILPNLTEFLGYYLSEALNWGRLLLKFNGSKVRLLFEGGSCLSEALINVITVCTYVLLMQFYIPLIEFLQFYGLFS